MEPTTTGVATAGTSLEILAPYLPYGIEVQYMPRSYRAKIWNLGQKTLKMVGHDPEVWIKDCLPCLRPFTALTQQLPDGTGSYAVELAMRLRMISKRDEFVSIKLVNDARFGLSIRLQAASLYEVFLQQKRFDEADYSCQIADWLRSQKFALPINGKPLLEGIDFIAL